MPGPCNVKKKRKSLLKKSTPRSNPLPKDALRPPLESQHIPNSAAETLTPYIHDPGNGPRVKDTRAFLGSYFAQPVSLYDPLCAEFAQEEVLEMLRTVLPNETAEVCPLSLLLGVIPPFRFEIGAMV